MRELRARWLIGGLLACLLAAEAPAQGGFQDLLRSITGTFTGGRGAPQRVQTETSTIGVRGMDEAQIKATPASPESVQRLEGWAATKADAERAARKKGLQPREAAYRAEQLP